MTKYTPAPWFYSDDTSSTKINIWGNNNKIFVAELEKYCLDKNSLANARLISSAPELLEACKSVRALFLRNYEKGTLGYQINQELEHAIAKAEGKTND